MKFTPDHTSRREPKPDAAIMSVIALLGGVLSAEPAMAAPSPQTPSPIETQAVDNEEAELKADQETVRKAQHLLEKAALQKGEKRLQTLVDANALLSNTVDHFPEAAAQLAGITLLVTEDPGHTPGMDLALTVSARTALDEGGTSSYIDNNAVFLLNDMQDHHATKALDELVVGSDATVLQLTEARLRLAKHRTGDGVLRTTYDAKVQSKQLGEFYMQYHVEYNEKDGTSTVVPGQDYERALEVLSNTGNEELFRQAADKALRGDLISVYDLFNATQKPLVKLALITELENNSRYANLIQDAGWTKIDVRYQLEPFYNYLKETPNEAALATLDKLVELGKE